jgi:hypothetical protein
MQHLAVMGGERQHSWQVRGAEGKRLRRHSITVD